MEQITKHHFVTAIEAIRCQVEKDKRFADTNSQLHNVDNYPLYDNSTLIRAIIGLLQISFPKIDGYCEIEHYCFELNFGKNGGLEVLSPEDLWDQLTREEDNGLYSKDNAAKLPENIISKELDWNDTDKGVHGRIKGKVFSNFPKSDNVIIIGSDSAAGTIAKLLMEAENGLRYRVVQHPEVKNFIDSDINWMKREDKDPGSIRSLLLDEVGQWPKKYHLNDMMRLDNHVIRVRNIEQLKFLKPDYHKLNELNELFVADKNHSEFLAAKFSFSKGWKYSFEHPEHKTIIDFENIDFSNQLIPQK